MVIFLNTFYVVSFTSVSYTLSFNVPLKFFYKIGLKLLSSIKVVVENVVGEFYSHSYNDSRPKCPFHQSLVCDTFEKLFYPFKLLITQSIHHAYDNFQFLRWVNRSRHRCRHRNGRRRRQNSSTTT